MLFWDFKTRDPTKLLRYDGIAQVSKGWPWIAHREATGSLLSSLLNSPGICGEGRPSPKEDLSVQ